MKDNTYTLITGAGRGIGYELAKLFASKGYNLVVTASDEADLNKLTTKLSNADAHIISIPKDLSNPNEAKELYDEIKLKNIYVNTLVNVAIPGHYGDFILTELAHELDSVMQNIASMLVLTKSLVKDMISNGEGKILNVVPVASGTIGPYKSVMQGIKGFLYSFSEGLRKELQPQGISVTTLLPGTSGMLFNHKPELEEFIPIEESKLAEPIEVAIDAFEGFMNKKDILISGYKNTVDIVMSKPDDESEDLIGNERR